MRFLIVGNSSIVARRALPALLQLPGVQSVDIASRRPLQHSSLPENWNGRIYDDYREAITDSQADMVACENWDDINLIEGYRYQSNFTGTGIVGVGHMESLDPLTPDYLKQSGIRLTIGEIE